MKQALLRTWDWVDDRTGLSGLFDMLRAHLAPPGATWNYVWGSATLFCLIVQVVTGVSLAFLYQPSADVAYASLQYIEHQAFLGSAIRGLHNWGASGMVVLLGIHMMRVYLNAAYKFPREMSWITGVLLMGIVVVMAFTGQLLRWDDNGVWSAVVAAEQLGRIPLVGDPMAYFLLGGKTINGESLNRFFAMHTLLFPALLIGVVSFHVYLAFRNGISEPPVAGRPVDPATYRAWYQDLLKRQGVPFFPDAIWRDALFSAFVLVVLVALAVFVGAPALTSAPDVADVHANPKPDWYLVWIFALYALMPRQIESFMIVFGPLAIVVVLFAIPFLSRGGERSAMRRPWAVIGVVTILVAMASLTYVGYREPWSPRFDAPKLVAAKVLAGNNADGLASVTRGIELFNTTGCLYCHQIDGQGGIRGPDLTTVARRMDRPQLIIRIVNGARNMPAYGGSLSDRELGDLVAFLEAPKTVRR